jgi:hypothetical protein
MSKDKLRSVKSVEATVTSDVPVNATPVPTPPMPPTPPTPSATPINVPAPRLADDDKAVLDLAKSRKETASALAREAQAKGETAELAFRYVVLQLYMKYGLSQNDALGDDGSILIGGAAQQQRR